MECPICYNIICNSCIGSCTHHFCLPCLIKWCENGGTSCPICKLIIQEIRPDIEFNLINSPNFANFSIDECTNKIIINPTNTGCAGITLANNSNFHGLGKRGPGVIIKKLNSKDNCYKKGLRVNDIILFLNNVPCITHKQSIDLIDCCCRINKSITFILLKVKK